MNKINFIILVLLSVIIITLGYVVYAITSQQNNQKSADYMAEIISQQLIDKISPSNIQIAYDDGTTDKGQIISAEINGGKFVSTLNIALSNGNTATLKGLEGQPLYVTKQEQEAIMDILPLTGDNPPISPTSVTTIIKETTILTEVPDGSIVKVKLANGAVTTEKLADNSVTSAKLIDGSISGSKLQNAVILTQHLNDSAVTEVKIADGAITTNKILAGSVTNDKLASDSVTSDKIADGTITAADLGNSGCTNGQLLKWNAVGSNWECKDDLTGGSSMVDWTDITNRPVGLDDGDNDTIVSEAQVEGYITNGPLNFDSGSTIGTEAIATEPWVNGLGYITNDTNVPKNDLTNSGTLPYTWGTSELDSSVMVSGENVSLLNNDSGYITNDTNVPKNNLTNSGALAFTWGASELVSDVIISGENISQLVNNAGYLTTYTETDPTLSTWTGSSAITTIGTVTSGSINSSIIANNTILFADLNQNGCADGEVMKWNTTASSWVCGADLTSGGGGTLIDNSTVTIFGSGGTAFASDYYPTRPPIYAFDVDISSYDGGWVNNGGNSGHIGYQFPAATTFIGYAIYPYTLADARGVTRTPKDWIFQGSNNGSSWTNLDTQTNQTGWVAGIAKNYFFTNTTKYTYYRLIFTTNNGDGYSGIAEMRFYITIKAGGGSNIGDMIGSGTAGSILFVDASGNLAQNNPNFFWDNGNSRLGIGTNTPRTSLDILGAFNLKAISAPGLSVATEGRIYFDTTTKKFKVSENGGDYVNLVNTKFNPDTPPSSPNALDDEFDAAGLDAKWTWINQNGATATLSQSQLLISKSVTGGDQDMSITQDVTFPSTITAKIAVVGDATYYHWGGIVLRESSTGKLEDIVLMSRDNGWFYIWYRRMTNSTTFNADVTNIGAYVANSQTLPIYLRATVTNTQIIYEWSSLGIDGSWVTLFTENKNTFFTTGPDEAGLSINAYNKPVKMLVDWFRVTSP
ncbi:MAG: hypothetical protein WCJ58_01190 [bacterium]